MDLFVESVVFHQQWHPILHAQLWKAIKLSHLLLKLLNITLALSNYRLDNLSLSLCLLFAARHI